MGECQFTPRAAADLLKQDTPENRKEFKADVLACSMMDGDKRFSKWMAQVKDENWKDRNNGGHVSTVALDVNVANAKKGSEGGYKVTDVSLRGEGNGLQFATNTRPSETIYQSPDYGSFSDKERKPLLSEKIEMSDRLPRMGMANNGFLTMAMSWSDNSVLTDTLKKQ